MGIFDDFGKAVTDTYKSATKASGKLIEEGKIYLMIKDNEAEMKEIFERIGKEYCETYFRGELLDNAKFENDYEELKRMQLENDEARARLLQLKKLRKCENCQKEISAENLFCQYCGTRQPEIVEEPQVEEVEVDEEPKEVKCKNCNIVLDSDSVFCPKCGQKVE